MFYISAGFYLFGSVVYSIFASGDVQKWAQHEVKEVEQELEALNHDPENKQLAVSA